MDSKDLESEITFFKVMKELRDHSETCKNDMCKEHKWNKKEVIEVVEVGKKNATEDGDGSEDNEAQSKRRRVT